MACVGQTKPQALQSCLQLPLLGVSTGEKMSSTQPLLQAGCNPFVGQALIHKPQRTQRERNSISGKAPGGRNSASGLARGPEFGERMRLALAKCTKPNSAPMAVAPINARREGVVRENGRST